MFHDMLAAKVRPTTGVFNNLISGLSRSGHAHSGSDHAHNRSDHAHRAFKYFNDVSFLASQKFVNFSFSM